MVIYFQNKPYMFSIWLIKNIYSIYDGIYGKVFNYMTFYYVGYFIDDYLSVFNIKCLILQLYFW